MRKRPMLRTLRFMPLCSCLALLASSFLLPKTSSAQGRYFTQSSGTILQVYPDTMIDFGRVRLGAQRDSFFIIKNISAAPITLTSLKFWESLKDSEFIVDSVDGLVNPDSITLITQSFVTDTVHFYAKRLGADTGSIPIYWRAGNQPFRTPTVVLIGTGVAPRVLSRGNNFGNWRVDSVSPLYTISIVNQGTDTTAIDSVTIVDSTEIANSDFRVTLDSLPPSGPRIAPLRIGYEGGDNTLSFTVQFKPHALGLKMLVFRIHSIDGEIVFDTVLGTGVEPLVMVNPKTVDFGTITLQPSLAPPLPMAQTFFVSNALGTYRALLDTLTHSDTAGHFTVQLDHPTTSNETLDSGSTVMGTVTFHITEEGDFADTILLPNDTRYALYPTDSLYQPMILVKAKVRTGPIGNFAVSFADTITTCDTVRQDVTISNPYPVEVYIDTILLVSDTAGFSYGQSSFVQKISMPPNGTYTFHLAYAFPLDSLNGPQALKIALFQRRRDNDSQIIDTVTASLVRKEHIVTLQAHSPQAGALGTSAADISQLRLPIALEGPRSGVTELNSWTFSLHFSNDLFEPTAVDTTGSLAVPGALPPTPGSSYSLTTYWDQPTRTYTIIVTGSAVSDPARAGNDLLLTIVMQAYLTTDTAVTVTPTFAWTERPCAYALQSFTLSIPYSNDCGDPTIRDVLLGGTPSFILTGSCPNPVNKADGVSLSYRAAEPCEVTATVYNVSGEELGHFETSVVAGAGTIALPTQLIPVSDPAFVRVEAVSISGGMTTVQTCKIAVMK